MSSLLKTVPSHVSLSAVRIASIAVFPLATLVLVSLGVRASGPPAVVPIHYNSDIRPILSENCFPCHGPDRNKRAAGLRLDQREAALTAGAIVPGSPAKSKLIARIFAAADSGLMPPADSHKELTPVQREKLRRWVAEGAVYEPHWSYIAPKRSAIPAVAKASWVRSPVDAFILARLEKEKISPSLPADRRTLLRRVTLDLTGLPPTPAEVNAFLADTRPDAYERVVDRLMASPHYGERMAVPWLDMVRFADTVGFHGDQNQNVWAYRDYIIDAYNRNKPFDRFVVEQIAGDLLPSPTPEQLTATCFNRLNMMTREGGAQSREYLAKYSADRVRTVSMAFMGSTFGCAECHDHKYDPISQRDFYSLAAFFADVQQWGIYADYGYTPNPELRGYNNDYPFPPEITVESQALKQRITRKNAALAKLVTGTSETLRRDGAAKTAFDTWRQASLNWLNQHPEGWETPKPDVRVAQAMASKKGAAPATASEVLTATVEPAGRVALSDKGAGNLALSVTPETRTVAALRLEVLPPAPGSPILRAGMDSAILTLAATLRHADGKTVPIVFRHAAANIAEPRYANGFELIGVQRGWKLATKSTETPVSVWLPATPLTLAPGDSLVVNFPNLSVAGLRVSVSPFTPLKVGASGFGPNDVAILREQLSNKPDAESVLQSYLMGTAWNGEAFTAAKALEFDILACRDGRTPVMVAHSVKPAVQRVLPRGNWQDESGPIVEPSVPHFLPGYVAAPKQRRTRLDLAKWLISPENPLTSRVYVNRLWRQFFGNGISGLVEDLGAQGEWPTHPELLDWLAVEFRESGWNVKHMVRLMVTSSTYKQSSSLRPELRDRDPNNRLLASQNPRRLEAEFVRDNALAVTGLLDSEVGGPSAKPYQPAGYYTNIQFPDRDYVTEVDERQWRRGLYMHWQRTFLHPMLANFDAPSREDAICTRTVANTPQQALTLLNDPEFVEAARVFATSVLSDTSAKNDAARIATMYERALARPPKPKETASLLAFLTKVRAAYKERPDDAGKLLGVGIAPTSTKADKIELASWTTVARVVLNLQETITRY